MTATADEPRYEVIVTRDLTDPARLHYQTARVRAPGEDGDHLELLGELTTPECTQADAREMALAWLRLRRPVPDRWLELVWAVTEPGAKPGRGTGGDVRYATVRRPRLRLRGR
jgi:hypothetical protein